MIYSITAGNVYYSDGVITRHIGPEVKVETVRIDQDTVQDTTSTFILEEGSYVVDSVETRYDPEPPSTPSEIDNLKARLIDVELMLTDILFG